MLEPEKWIQRYADYLLNYAFYRVSDRETAEDLVQETFVSALKSKNTYNGTAGEKTWLTAILKNKVIDYYRSKLHKNAGITDSLDVPVYFNGEDNDHWVLAKAPKEWNTERSLEQKEFYETLRKCMNKLPEKTAVAFSLKYLEDAASEDICKELQITSSNYWIMMHRAKLQLRECMEKNWFKA